MLSRPLSLSEVIMPKNSTPLVPPLRYPAPRTSDAILGALKLYYDGVAASGKPLLPLESLRLNRSIPSMAVGWVCANWSVLRQSLPG